MMKRMAVAVMMMAGFSGGVMAHAQASAPAAPVKFQDDLFVGTEKFAKNAISATEVTMDPQTLGLVDGKDQDKARSTKLSVVRTYTYDKPGMYDAAEVEAYRSKLSTGDWHCSVRTRDLKTGSSSDICNRSRADGLWESAIVTVSPKSLTFIHTIKTRPTNGGYYGGSSYNVNEWSTRSGMEAERSGMEAERSAERAAKEAERAAGRVEMEAELRAMRGDLTDLQTHVHVDLHDLHVPEVRMDALPKAVPAPPVEPAVPAVPDLP